MQKLILPRLGQTMEVGIVTEWRVAEGQAFQAGEVLYEVETEKATNDVEATLAGRIVRLLVQVGEEVPVGTVLAVLAEANEEPNPDEVDRYIASLADTPESATLLEGEDNGESTKRDEGAVLPKPPAMPAARRRAEELGVDLAAVRGTGRSGTVKVEDVDAFVGGPALPERSPTSQRRPLTSVSKAMAANVTRSWVETPQFHQVITVDASNLLERLETERRNAPADTKLTISAVGLRAVAAAASQVPESNASFDGDALVLHDGVDISVAVDTPQGLLVPVLRRVQDLTLVQVAQELGQLAERARAGNLELVDFEGGSMTFSNLGMHGIDFGAPLVVTPQSTIVFLGAVRDEVVAIDRSVAIRPVMKVSAGFDHRVLDGATAGRFMGALKRQLEATTAS